MRHVDDPVDVAMLARLDAVVDEATTAFDGFDYARALERSEAFFWWFCDDYVELVKGRAYGGRGDGPAASARAALRRALEAQLRLLAPTLPFATEEAWSWWHDGSIHAASWPTADGAAGGDGPVDLDAVSEVLARVRRKKTEAKASQRASVSQLRLSGAEAVIAALRPASEDLRDTLTVADLDLIIRARRRGAGGVDVELG